MRNITLQLSNKQARLLLDLLATAAQGDRELGRIRRLLIAAHDNLEPAQGADGGLTPAVVVVGQHAEPGDYCGYPGEERLSDASREYLRRGDTY